MKRSRTIICNFDDKPGALCRDGCVHPWILYVPMAAGLRCDRCRTFQSDDLKPESWVAFHERHSAQARCQQPPAGQGSGDE